MSEVTYQYGPGREHFGVLVAPDNVDTDAPITVLIHGGFWRERVSYQSIMKLAHNLAHRGIVAWVVEYDRVNESSRPMDTPDSTMRGVSYLAQIPQLGASLAGRHVTVCGHSAGGHLALYVGLHHQELGYRVNRVIALAPVADLRQMTWVHDIRDRAMGTHDNPVREWLKDDYERLVDQLSPTALGPIGLPLTIVQGTLDTQVPWGIVEGYCTTMQEQGAPLRLVKLDTEHFSLIDPDSEAGGHVTQLLSTTA